MTHQSLAQRLRVLRAARGITLAEAEELTGVTRETLGALEKGQRGAYTSTLEKIAEGYGTTVSALMEVGDQDLALAGSSPKAVAPSETGRLPEWARTSDMNTFSKRVSNLPPDELQRLAVEMIGGEPVLTREDLPLSREKRGARVASFARAMVVAEEFLERGVAPPPEFEVAYRRHLKALASPPTPDVEAQRPAPGIPEAG